MSNLNRETLIEEMLIERGRSYLKQFAQVDFVGEIEIPEDELDDLCSAVWRNLAKVYNNADLCALLTTVVVNLAYYSRENLNSKSFRWLVLNRLSRSEIEDNSIWEDQIGTPVLKTLQTHFGEMNEKGSYRFVRPIMQQAGVPYSTIPQFVNFFNQLVKRCGDSFYFQEYERFRRGHQVQSRTLSNFLDTLTGFHYCSEISRIYRNIRNGILLREEIDELPPRIRETIRLLQAEPAGSSMSKPKPKVATPPQLAIDKEQLRLKLLFPDESLEVSSKTRYRINKLGSIQQSSYFLPPADIQNGSISGTVSFNHRSENWEVALWQPEIEPWGLFSVSSGVFLQSNGRINPGEYLVVVPDDSELDGVLEDYGYFNYPGLTRFVLKVYHARLEPGFTIPEASFAVSNDSLITPRLRFSESNNMVRYSSNVFSGSIPRIIIDNWNENTLKDHFVSVTQGGESTRISDCSISDGVITYSPDAPSYGRISLEAKGKALKGFRPSTLSFSVIPNDFEFVWRNELYSKGDMPDLEIKPCNKVAMVWHNESVEPEGKGKWRVNPFVDQMEMMLEYDKKVKFRLTVPVYRLSLNSELFNNKILWHKELDQLANIAITLSPNERGQIVAIGVVSSDPFTEICDLKVVPNNFRLELSTDEVRDAFEDRRIPAGILAIKTARGKIIRSDVIYVNEEILKNRTFDRDEEFDKWVEFLPDELRSSIELKRKAHLSDQIEPREFPKDLPESIKEWISDDRPDFVLIQKCFREFSESCRNQYWNRVQLTEIGSSEQGTIFLAAVKKYHDAVEAEEINNADKSRRFLENVYKSLEGVPGKKGVLAQLAAFLRFVCCLRLEEIDTAKKEMALLDDYWNKIVSSMALKFPDLAFGRAPAGQNLEVNDVFVHHKDPAVFTESTLGENR